MCRIFFPFNFRLLLILDLKAIQNLQYLSGRNGIDQDKFAAHWENLRDVSSVEIFRKNHFYYLNYHKNLINKSDVLCLKIR